MKALLSWLRDFVDINITAKELADKLTMVGLEVTLLQKVDDDYLFDIEVTPNRCDCLSLYGIAREVALVTEKRLKPMRISYPPRISAAQIKQQDFEIQIQDAQACLRYIGRIILNVEVKESPPLIKSRLEKMGLRVINNIVDITNYVLLELGHPLHAFDYNKIRGGKIIVRWAKAGEKLITIDGEQRILSEEDLIIADIEKPHALAGIMGGKESEVGPETKAVLLESACFSPLPIMRSSRRHGLTTESSYRFERGVDYFNVERASLRAVELMRKYGSKTKKRLTVTIDKEIDLKAQNPPLRATVHLKLDNIKKVLGILPPTFWLRNIFRGLGIEVIAQTKDGFKLEPPSFRKDLKEEIDYIEEIARLYGYDKIPAQQLPRVETVKEPELLKFSFKRSEDAIRNTLRLLGLSEVITYALIGEDEVKFFKTDTPLYVTNPLTMNYAILRPSVIPSLLKVANYNFNRNIYDLAIFELGKVYHDGEEPSERKVIGILLAGIKYQDYQQNKVCYNFYDLKGIIEALLERLAITDFKFESQRFSFFTPASSTALYIKDQMAGFMGKPCYEIMAYYDIKEDVYIAEIDFSLLNAYRKKVIKYQQLALYPSTIRDLSFSVDENFKVGEIIDFLRKRSNLIADVFIIDLYRGRQIPQGKKGITLRLKFQSQERTLRDEEVDAIFSHAKEELINNFPICFR